VKITFDTPRHRWEDDTTDPKETGNEDVNSVNLVQEPLGTQ